MFAIYLGFRSLSEVDLAEMLTTKARRILFMRRETEPYGRFFLLLRLFGMHHDRSHHEHCSYMATTDGYDPPPPPPAAPPLFTAHLYVRYEGAKHFKCWFESCRITPPKGQKGCDNHTIKVVAVCFQPPPVTRDIDY